MSIVAYHGLSFEYPDADRPAVTGVEISVDAAEIYLVVGSSGSGKSTLLRAANGIVPHSTGGRLDGWVEVAGRSTRSHRPRDMTDLVGFVHQDPEAQFVVDQVEADIAFALENLGYEPTAMRRRVEEVLDALGIAHLRDRSPSSLSGGERQRAAIAGALAAAPRVLVLDEPTAELDPQGSDDVFAALARLNSDLGTTIMLAEHGLERAAPLADRAALVEHGRVSVEGLPSDILADYPGAAPVTHLGKLMGWSPPPLTVREAMRHVTGSGNEARAAMPAPLEARPRVGGATFLEAQGLGVDLAGRTVLRGLDLEVRAGEVVALFGRNGSGKTTLLRALAGLSDSSRGTVTRARRVGYVPQDPNTLLFRPTVRDELVHTLRLLGRGDDLEPVERWMARLSLAELAERHPRSLSGGERQRVAIAAVAVGGADVLLLDEPTRGIDAASRDALASAIDDHAEAGGAVVLATHDVELAARVASRAVVLGDGEVVASGSARDVLAGSLFAPQVLRVMPPFLTVGEVAATPAEQP